MLQILGLGLIGAFVGVAALMLVAAMIWAIWKVIVWCGSLRRSRLVKKELTAYEARKQICVAAPFPSAEDEAAYHRAFIPAMLQSFRSPKDSDLDEFDRRANEHRALTARLLEKFDRRKAVR